MGTVIHDDFWAAAQAMPPKQRPDFIYAICSYVFDGTEPVGSPAWLPTFIVLKDRLDMGAAASERGRSMAEARWGKARKAKASGAGDARACAQADAQARARADAQAHARADAQAHAQAPGAPDAEKEVEKEKEINTPIAPERDDPAQAVLSGACAEIVAHLNARLGTSYRADTRKTRELIRARMNEGFTVADFKAVIDRKADEWRDDPKMCRYLRPETLFSPKFDGYLNSPEARKGAGYADYAF